MACYTSRTYEERRTIQRMWEAGVQAKEIADKLNAPLSSIYSELRRGQDGSRLPNQRLCYNAERSNPTWWLNQAVEGQSRIVMWVKRDGYRKAMEEFAGKIREARSEREKTTGDKTFTHLEALLTELVEVLTPDEKCRVVMDYDPDAENIILSQLPVRDI